MTALRVLASRVRGMFGRSRRDGDLDEEVRAHLAMLAEEHLRRGLSREQALAAARRDFGGVEVNKEAYRDVRGFPWVEALGRDLRHTVRQFARSPGFLLTVVLILGLGIGANTAIFSVVHAALLRALPYRNADRLVSVWEYNLQQRHINTVSGANLADWQAQGPVFDDLAYSWDEQYTLTGGGPPESLFAYQLSSNFFDVLGASALSGRTFLPDQGQPGRDHVAVLSYRLWQRRFAGDPKVLNRPITLNGQAYTVVGIMPPGFAHPSAITDLWTPLALGPEAWSDRRNHMLRVVGRLRPGVGVSQAQVRMSSLAARLAALYPQTNAGMSVQLVPLRDSYTGDLRTTLWVLQAAVLLLLLIACANVANLLLARAVAREREVAVRTALGASRSRLFQQFLVEGLTLSACGAVLGFLLAWAGVRFLPALLPQNLFLLNAGAVTLDGPVLAFSLVLTALSGAVFGAVPAWRIVAYRDRGLATTAGGRGHTGGLGRSRLRGALVVSEVALSVLLLVSAGLLMRSFEKLASRSLGLRPDHVLTARLVLPPNKYKDGPAVDTFSRQVIERLEASPGVLAAGAVNTLPLTGQYALRSFAIGGRPAPLPGQQSPAAFQLVTPRYFEAMGIPLRRGRRFSDGDRPGAPGVAIVSESFARRYWPNEDAIGKRVQIADAGTPEWREVVGVVGDTRQLGLETDPVPTVYRPFAQAYWPFLSFAARSSGDPAALASTLRQAIWQLDKDEPVTAVQTMDQVAAGSVAMRRLSTGLIAVFSAVALLLAALGIFGVVNYGVRQRTNEIGVRMALGASVAGVLRMVVGHGLMLAVAGVVLGLLGAWGATRFLVSMLVEVRPMDPLTVVSAALVLLAIALAACLGPARRAATIDPAAALRHE